MSYFFDDTMIQTKITHLLDQHQISYRVLPHQKPVFTVEEAAAQRGVVRGEMVKSILLREGKRDRFVMACLLGDARLDPKAVRTYLPDDWRRLTFASAEDILTVTGYTQGAVAPLCLPDTVPVIFDEAISTCQNVNISSGDLMQGLELKSADLLLLTGAKLGKIIRPS